MADENLSLGTLFTAELSKDFLNGVRKIRSELNRLATFSGQLSKNMREAASAQAMNTNAQAGFMRAVADVIRAQADQIRARAEVAKGSAQETRAQAEILKAQAAEGKAVASHRKAAADEKKADAALMNASTKDRAQRNKEAEIARKSAAAESRERVQKLRLEGEQVKANAKLTAAQIRAAQAADQHTGSQRVLGKQISHVSGTVERLQAALKVVAAYTVAGTAVVALVSGLRSGVDAIINFDQSLKNLQAITGATGSEVLGMGDAIKSVARDTKFSSAEVADGMTLLGQAGFSAQESMNAIRATATLATGTLSGFDETVDLLSTSIRAWNMQSIEAGRVADVMAYAVNKSKLTIEGLRTVFNYAGASSAEAGLSFEQTAASTMVLADRGLRMSTIGTGLRRVVSELVNPSKDLAETLENNGIAVDQLNPKVVGYEAALKLLTRVMWDNEKKAIDMGKAYKFFELRGAQAVAVLLRAFNSGEYKKAIEGLSGTDSVGASAEMAALQMEGLEAKFKNMANQAKLAAIAIGEAGVTGALHSFVDALRSVASGIEYLVSTSIGEFVTKFALASGAIALVVGGLKALGVFWLARVTIEFGKVAWAVGLANAQLWALGA